jgi:hypothetical protein
VADSFSPVLRAVGAGDGDYAFHIRYLSDSLRFVMSP